jgi:enamine deaminase RidA (YjgF/YER057c/UK114 family)
LKEHLNPPQLYSGPGFSQVVTAGGGKTVYISGQIAMDASLKLIGRRVVQLEPLMS